MIEDERNVKHMNCNKYMGSTIIYPSHDQDDWGGFLYYVRLDWSISEPFGLYIKSGYIKNKKESRL